MSRKRKTPPGIFETANGKYEYRYREGNRHRSKTFDHLDDAITFKANRRLARQRGEQIIRRQDVPTFEAVSIEFLERRETIGKATKTLETNAYYLDRAINPYIGHLATVDVTIDVLDEWQAAALNDGRSAYVVNRSRELIGAIMKYAMRRRWANQNPAELLEVLPHRPQRGQVASIEQVELMREYFIRSKRPGYAAMISVLAYIGLRPSELTALTWGHVKDKHLLVEDHTADGEIVDGTKTHTTRLVPIPAPVVTDLAEWKLAGGRFGGLIFPRTDGQPWQDTDYRNWSRRWFKAAAAEAGLLTIVEPETGPEKNRAKVKYTGDFTPYDLRHTCASLKIRAGTPPATIAKEMGHSIETLFRIYSHEIEQMRDTEVAPIDHQITEIRQPGVRRMYGRKAL